MMVPFWPNCEDAEITLVASGCRRLVVMKMFPPGPKTAFASDPPGKIWSRMNVRLGHN